MTSVAIVSDTHFGDPLCCMCPKINGNYVFDYGYFHRFQEALGDEGVDYLVLSGDVFDFSVASQKDAYDAGKSFFTGLVIHPKTSEEKLLVKKGIIYLPGNHDYSFWSWVEHQMNIINNMTAGNPLGDYRYAVPCVLDLRKRQSRYELYLAGVTRNPDGKRPYGVFFLETLTRKKIPFIVAYPNLYLVTDSGTTLVTHGQYIEDYWALISDYGPLILKDDFPAKKPFTMKELVGVNVPANELASTAIGQAGCLTDFIREFQRKMKDGKIEKLKEYIKNLQGEVLDPALKYRPCDLREPLTDLALWFAKKRLLKAVEEYRRTRGNTKLLASAKAQERFIRFFDACLMEIRQLNILPEYADTPIPKPDWVIYGHTHVPLGMDQKPDTIPQYGTELLFYNTGGWLYTDQTRRQIEGAVVFSFAQGRFGSVRI